MTKCLRSKENNRVPETVHVYICSTLLALIFAHLRAMRINVRSLSL